jgi:hypothetical protein
MSSAKRTLFLLSVVFATATFGVASAHAGKPDKPGGGGGKGDGDTEFELVELDLGGTVNDINDSGMMVGDVDGVAGAWDAHHQVPTFLPLSATTGFGSAHAINEAGEIVGGGAGKPRYWSNLDANPIDLLLPQGFLDGVANGISNDGIIVGSVTAPGVSAAVAWRVNGNSVFGPVLLTSSNTSTANDVASLDSGVTRAVGADLNSDDANVATTWDLKLLTDGSLTVIDSTVLVSDQESRVNAIIESGDMAGIIADSTGNDRLDWADTAFVVRDGSLNILPSGKRNQFSVGRDLNDTDVVGATGRSWQPQDVAQWNSRGRLEDITSYFGESWLHTDAQGINGQGEIVGFGVMDDNTFAWLLRHPLVSPASASAIPEPSTFVMVAFGLLGLATRARRSRRSTRC